MTLRPLREWWRELDEVTDLGPVVRRYFVIGAFDGALTVLGIMIGAYAALAGRPNPGGFVIAVSISASIALAISSMVGAYEAERIEKKLHRHSIERAMLVGLSEEHRSAFRTAALVSAAVHGVAPVIAALIPVVPFFFIEFLRQIFRKDYLVWNCRLGMELPLSVDQRRQKYRKGCCPSRPQLDRMERRPELSGFRE